MLAFGQETNKPYFGESRTVRGGLRPVNDPGARRGLLLEVHLADELAAGKNGVRRYGRGAQGIRKLQHQRAQRLFGCLVDGVGKRRQQRHSILSRKRFATADDIQGEGQDRVRHTTAALERIRSSTDRVVQIVDKGRSGMQGRGRW